MAKTYAVIPISPVRYTPGEKYRTWPTAAGETFLKGAPIERSSAGNTFEEHDTADPTSGIVGFALAGAADYAWQDDTFGTVVPSVPVALADQEFRGSLANSNTSTPETISDVSAVIGTTYGLVKDSETGYWVLNHDDTTGGVAKVTGVDPTAEDGDANIPVTFVLTTASREVIA